MIAEAGVLSTSPWNSDNLLKDCSSDVKSFFNTNDVLNYGFPLFDVEQRNNRGELEQELSSSGSTSSTSSDCSEEISLDVFLSTSDDIICKLDHDYLNTSLNLLDDDSMAVCPPEFDWVDADNLIPSVPFLNEDATNEETPDTHTIASPKQKRNNSVDPVTDTKLWSRMARNEQFEAVENLTNIISTAMGLREQLDIIRIIDPNAVISSTDTEFVIDLCALNDVKLCKVREYVRKVLASQEVSQNHKRSPAKPVSNTTSAKCKSSTSNVGKCTAGVPPVKSKSVKKKEAKEKRAPQKVYRQRLKKEHRQILKERRSGLFVREEVLALCTCPYLEEESDIDICE